MKIERKSIGILLLVRVSILDRLSNTEQVLDTLKGVLVDVAVRFLHAGELVSPTKNQAVCKQTPPRRTDL